MVFGNMGSKHHMALTVMGDEVNLASRLEGLAPIYGAAIIVSDATLREAGDEFAARELDPAGWGRMDKVVLDDFSLNYRIGWFREMVDSGALPRERLHGELWEVVSGAKEGRSSPEESVLIHTTGLVSQDVAIAHSIYRKALETGAGVRLPAAHTSREAAR